MTDPRTPDPAADGPLGELLEHADWIHALARSLVRDPSTADDLVQETWSAALEHPRSGLPSSQARPWLATVLRNRWRSWLRGEGRRAAREREVASDEALPPEDETLERMERQRALLDLVVELDEPYRRAVILRYYEGLSTQEIARRTGEPHERVRWRLRRGLALLREKLERRHGAEWGPWCALLLPFGERAAPLGPLAPGPAGAIEAGATAAPTTVTAGALLMNTKTLLAAAAVTAGLGFTFWVTRSPATRVDEVAEAAPATVVSSPAGVVPDTAAQAAPPRPALVGPLPAGFARVPLPEEEAPAEPVGELRGRVIAEEGGAPIAGARLVLLAENDTPAHRHDEVLVETVSGEGGAFELPRIPPDEYHLSCRLEGRAPVLLRGILVRESQSNEVEVVLSHGAELEVFVTEAATGLPVSGAEVLAIAGDEGSVSIVSTAGVDYHSVSGVSQESGQVLIEGVARGENQLVVRAPGFANWMGELRVRRDSERAEVALLRGGTLRGRVTRDDGLGVEGTYVFLNPERTTKRLRVYEFATNGVAVAADGGFTIPGVPAGAHYVVALAADGAAGFHMQASGELGMVTIAEGEETWLDLPIPVPAVLAGRVLDERGEPVEGASVSISWGDFMLPGAGYFPLYLVEGAKNRTHQAAKTDAEGRYRMSSVRPSYEPLGVRVHADGYSSGEFERRVRAGESVERDVVLESLSSSIFGRLATADGAGVPEVTVGAWAYRGGERMDLYLGRSADDGSFEIAVTASSDHFEVWPILRDGDAYTATPEKRPRVPAGAREVLFELHPKYFLTGEVVDEQGAPVPGFAISRADPTLLGDQLPDVLRDVDLGGGRFRIPCDPGRGDQIIFTAPGFATERRDRPDPRRRLRVVMVRPPDLHGRVLAPDGSALEGVLVCLATLDDLAFPVRSRHAPAARTDATGGFVLQGVPAVAGATLLLAPERAELPPLVRYSLDDAAGDEVLVQLEPPIEVAVETPCARVLAIDAVGWPLHPEVELVLADLRAADAVGFGDVHAGRTTLWLTPGVYHFVTADSEGLPRASDAVQVAGRGPVRVVLP